MSAIEQGVTALLYLGGFALSVIISLSLGMILQRFADRAGKPRIGWWLFFILSRLPWVVVTILVFVYFIRLLSLP